MQGFAIRASVPILALALVGSCAPAPPSNPVNAAEGTEQAILARSAPSDGATVPGPLDKIELWFKPAARLGEVTVQGPDGVMPMMVTAVGEVGYYSLPVSIATPGRYRVDWAATAGGREHKGSFAFVVK